MREQRSPIARESRAEGTHACLSALGGYLLPEDGNDLFRELEVLQSKRSETSSEGSEGEKEEGNANNLETKVERSRKKLCGFDTIG